MMETREEDEGGRLRAGTGNVEDRRGALPLLRKMQVTTAGQFLSRSTGYGTDDKAKTTYEVVLAARRLPSVGEILYSRNARSFQSTTRVFKFFYQVAKYVSKSSPLIKSLSSTQLSIFPHLLTTIYS